MSLSEKEIKHISHLARIGITDKEVKKIQKELDGIIGYIDKLQSLNVDKIKPMAHVLPLENVYREDKRKESLTPEKTLKNAPTKKDKSFSVPKVIE